MTRRFVNTFSVWNITTNLPNPKFTTTSLPKAVFLHAFFLFLLVLSGNTISSAAAFTVNTLTDNESDGCAAGNCTLREAVNAANALPGSDTINFQSGLTGTITLTGGHLLINDSVNITGLGARSLSVSGNNASRVFVISGSGVTAIISRLTVTGGNAVPILIGTTLIGDGGGILNANGATLNLTEAQVSNNLATSLGGGVATRAILGVTTTTNITRSLISGNSAVAGGGGVSNLGTVILSSAVTTISNSTITNNTALAKGGGLSNTAGTMNLTNDTISHNQSMIAGGGIINVAGILVGTVNIRNTILARNEALTILDRKRSFGGNQTISSDGLGIFNSLGGNLVGNNLDVEASFAASAEVGGVPQPNVNLDVVGSVAAGFEIIDPLLGALQNNGGLTDTRALMAGSPALDRADNCVFTNTCAVNPSGNNPSSALTTDQRGSGFTRLTNSIVDIGAYELQLPPTSAVVSVGGRVTAGKDTGVSKVRVSITSSTGETRTAISNAFGYYRFEDVEVGETYILQVSSKGYVFAPQVVNITEDTNDLNFSAIE